MLYFKDRVPEAIHGENARYYDAVDSNGTPKLQDFKLVLKNNIQADKEGTALNAANMNYASGIADLPAPYGGQTIKRGDLLAITGGKASLANMTKRSVTAQLVNTMMNGTFLKLSDTQYLLYGVGSSSASGSYWVWSFVVITVDWETKTVTFSDRFGQSYMNTGYVGAPNLEYLSANLVCMASQTNGTNPAQTVRFIRINGTTVTVPSLGGQLRSGVGYIYNITPVRCGNESVLLAGSSVAAGSTGTCSLYKVTYDAGSDTASVVASAVIPGVTDAKQLLSLVSYDTVSESQSGTFKYILFYSTGADGAGTVYAKTVTVNGNSISIGSSAQDVTGNIYTIWHHGGGTSPVSRKPSSLWQNKILFSSPYALGTPAQIQTADIDKNGTVTFGRRVTLPIYSGVSAQNRGNVNYGWATSSAPNMFVTLRDDGSALISGTAYYSPYYHTLIELTPDIDVYVYMPFNGGMYGNVGETVVLLGGNYRQYPSVCAAIENPTNRGEYIFMEWNGITNTSPNEVTMKCHFGFATDSPHPSNIAAVALDSPSNNINSANFIKAQLTPKLLPDIYAQSPSQNLLAGMWYVPGQNGSLTPYDPSLHLSSSRIGFALSPHDFLFSGPTPLF